MAIGPLLADAFREVVDLETRLLVTLRTLVTKPGRLTREYVAGRRAAYLSPFRLYVLATVVFGAAAAFSDLRFATNVADPDPDVWLRFWIWSVLGMLPIFAGILKLVVRTGRYYAEHLVFATHYHAFAFFVTAVVLPISELSPSFPLRLGILALLPVAVAVHLVQALRRSYGQSTLRALSSAVALLVGYSVVQFVALLLTGVIAGRVGPT
ncbi:MAG: DUF3667 domain-containing protein [Gemmatimonadota bacterium]